MSEVQCDGYIYCNEKDFDLVEKVLEAHHAFPEEINFGGDGVYLSARYFDQEDAEAVIDELGGKVHDFAFDFDDYSYDERSRYTKKKGFEKETRLYRSDVVDRLLKAGYSPQEASKIIELVV